MASIASFPPEIVDQICDLLGNKDICSLRLVCKGLSFSSFNYFATQQFSKIHVALTRDGMQLLKELASHEALGMYIKELWVISPLFSGHYTRTVHEFVFAVRNRKTPGNQNIGNSSRVVYRTALTAEDFVGREEAYQGYREKFERENAPTEADKEQYQIYQDAVSEYFQLILTSPDQNERGSRDRFSLEETLTSCLPCFPNLRATGVRTAQAAGLANGEDLEQSHNDLKERGVLRGAHKLERQLGFNPAFPPRSWAKCLSRCQQTHMNVLQSPVFTSLMRAIGETRSPIETLRNNYLMADDGLSLTPAQEDTLRPVIQRIRHLFLNISSAHGQDEYRDRLQQAETSLSSHIRTALTTTEFNRTRSGTSTIIPGRERDAVANRLLPIISEAATNLEKLSIFFPGSTLLRASLRRKFGADLADAHFDYMAHHFRFTRLHMLSLRCVFTSVPSFTRFLDTARATLKKLTLEHMCWTSDRRFEKTERDAQAVEAVRVTRLVFDYLRDFPELRYLKAGYWKYQRVVLTVREVHGPDNCKLVVFDAQTAIPLREWIDRVEVLVQ